MKTSPQLIGNIIGQLKGIRRMMEEEKDCVEVLIQIKAAKSALDSVTVKFINQDFSNCMEGITPSKKRRVQVLLAELAKLG
ncbi:metal-sensitive transcriptional regulator [Candidatus Peregrinibacteria bacterium]|nr:metal-sensitive transcriptional regulator [Candidatus Peregrinibacteria bacterium]